MRLHRFANAPRPDAHFGARGSEMLRELQGDHFRTAVTYQVGLGNEDVRKWRCVVIHVRVSPLVPMALAS